MDTERTPLPGSELKLGEGERSVSLPPADEKLTVTVQLRRPPNYSGPSAEDLLAGRAKPLSRDEAEKQLRADPADVEAVRSFAKDFDLAVVGENDAARSLKLQGTVSDLERAFGTSLQMSAGKSGHSYVVYRGALSVPKNLSGVVVSVLGMDGRPVARHADGQSGH
jgi:kumamolisin